MIDKEIKKELDYYVEIQLLDKFERDGECYYKESVFATEIIKEGVTRKEILINMEKQGIKK